MNRKKSFLVYFDICERVGHLPDEQLGLLFRAMVDCARKEAEGQDGITGVEQRYPRMREGTLMAFSFLAATIRRDAQTYAEKCENYRHAARRKAEGKAAASAAPPQEARQEQRGETKGETCPPPAQKTAKPAGLSRAASQRAEEVEAGRAAAWAYARALGCSGERKT